MFQTHQRPTRGCPLDDTRPARAGSDALPLRAVRRRSRHVPIAISPRGKRAERIHSSPCVGRRGMCCCCPAAIQALFCLWVQSGFSKGSVAGALTFFPPEPALYKLERRDKDGNLLPDYDEEEEEIDPLDDEHPLEDEDEGDEDEFGNDKQQEDEELLSPNDPPPPAEPLEVVARSGTASHAKEASQRPKRKKKKQQEEQSPASQLLERNRALRRRAKQRNKRDTEDAKNGVTYVFRLDSQLSAPPVRGAIVEAVKLPSENGVHLATVVYRLPPEHITENTKTLIFSHGNATDIGAMYALQAILAHSLDCHVVSYDYSGYGASGGVPMEKNTYRDIVTVYDYTKEYVAPDQDESKIVLYGQSVGSGPSCYLCAQRNIGAGGLILHSPFTSGMRVLTPSRALACLDIYPNINRISKVKCPVMVIHGVLDQEVDISHGQAMHNAVPSDLRREPWWVPDRGHNDITEGPGKLAEYLRRLRRFLNALDE